MNVDTGQTFQDYEAAVKAGTPPEKIVMGHPAAIRKLSKMVKARNKQLRERKAARKMQAASRKRNR